MADEKKQCKSTKTNISKLQAKLEPGEHLLWYEQPIPGLVAGRNLFLGLLGLSTVAFGGLATSNAITTTGHAPLINLFGLFIGIMISLAPIWAYLRARSTIYGISNQRVLRLTLFPWSAVLSWRRDEIRIIDVKTLSSGAGDILFRYNVFRIMKLDRQFLSLSALPDVHAAEQVLRSQADQNDGQENGRA